MDVKIWPYNPGDTGILCMPMQKNISEPKDSDWKLVECPKCKRGCWETDEHRKLLKSNPGLKAACTECALRAGIRVEKS